MNWKEMKAKYPEYREDMSVEREREFVRGCFDAYENCEVKADTFWTPFEDYQDKKIKIIFIHTISLFII